ncbi:ABC transporter ATP-binding protein [Glutamicibacter sp. JC586]|uniref:ABC transporter ATP-binding protein n=1 Tax=Glutamicibacter sp. JC586 TaxID=2590552 RepID=UPI00135C88F9|nr:ABC transporter ATP-binding protein [Glutamicibacter sp. JC586]
MKHATDEPVLLASDVSFAYGSGPTVLHNINLALHAGGAIGIVGESGSGKSTLAGLLVGMSTPTSGSVTVHGRPWKSVRRRDPQRLAVQMVFQNPYTALNPRLTILNTVAEVFQVSEKSSKAESLERARDMLSQVGLTGSVLNKRPEDLSGGQCQRVGIARALAAKPSVIVADEPTSALDVSVQAQILNQLRDLREEQDIGLILISHDLNVVSYLTDSAIVMQHGKVVEQGPTAQLLNAPAHSYTQNLVDSVF